MILLAIVACTLSTQGGTIKLFRNGVELTQYAPVLLTIQDAVGISQPGDVIELQGTFCENVVISKSGTSTQPITIRSAAGQTAIIDGSITGTACSSPSLNWTVYDANLGIYKTTVNYICSSGLPQRSSWISKSNGDMLVAYDSVIALSTLPHGEGTVRKYNPNTGQTDIYVRLSPSYNVSTNPANAGLKIGKSEGVITLMNQSHWKFQNLEIRYGAWAGVYIWGNTSNNIVCENLVIKNCYRGVSTDKFANGASLRPQNIQINGCQIVNQISNNIIWSRKDAYTLGIGGNPNNEEASPARNKGIFLCADYCTVAQNYLKGHFDAMGYQGTNTNIYNNTIENVTDDVIELESTISDNVKFYANYTKDVYTSVSTVSQSPGTVYIYRNVFENTKVDPLELSSGYTFKMGVNWACLAKNVKIYHNTAFAGKCSAWEKTDDPQTSCTANNNWDNFLFVNNLFISNGNRADCNFKGAGNNDTGGDNIWYNNTYYYNCPSAETGATCLSTTAPNTLTDLFVSPNASPKQLKIKSTSSAVNTGHSYMVSNSYPDVITYTGGNIPDRGAWELNATYTIGATNYAALRAEELNTVEDATEAQAAMSIFPNPVKDIVTLRFAQNVLPESGQLLITDALGKNKIFIPIDNSNNTLELNLSSLGLPSGLYLVKLNTQNSPVIGKFVLE